jgi:hypothetical protein
MSLFSKIFATPNTVRPPTVCPPSRRSERMATTLTCLASVGCALLVVLAFNASPTAAAEPWWHLDLGSAPANLAPGETGQIVVTASNLGDADANGAITPVTIADKLPKHLKALSIGAEAYNGTGGGASALPVSCSHSEEEGTCTFTGVRAPYEQIEVHISVEVQEGASSGELNEASVSGGGAPGVSTSRPVTIGEAAPKFGVESYEMTPEEEGGATDTQAGSHPFQLTTTTSFNQSSEPGNPPALTKDLHFNTPPGLVGNPTPFPQCPETLFLRANEDQEFADYCPQDTAVGIAAIKIIVPNTGYSVRPFVVPLFNLRPEVGEPARFGFYYSGVPVFLDTSVRTGEGYAVRVSVDNITQQVIFVSSRVTFWGVPGAPSHDNSRGWNCVADGSFTKTGPGSCSSGETAPPPLLTLPTSCTGPLETTVEADSWKEEGAFQTFSQNPDGLLPALDGCNRLPFKPTIGVAADEQTASSPSGLTVHISVPQSVDLDSEGLSESDVKDTTVTLPAGVTLNPSSSDGLQACPLLTGREKSKEAQEEKAEISGINLETKQPANCPNASKIATVEIHTPLLPNPLKGFVYLGEQEANPFDSLIAQYLVAYDPVSGVLIKLAGKVEPNPLTGQLVATFENTPQAPFDELELHFFGGERAPLATPAHCGTYTTTTSIGPWSENPASEPSSSFEINEGYSHSPCPGAILPFDPSSAGGALNLQAGAFSPFTSTLTRESGEQSIQSAEVKLPPGLSGLLSSVELCREPQANLGTCGPNSQIGETTVSVGVGGEPYTVKGGRVYITGPYNGTSECTVGQPGCAPFGLAVVNPAKAGPFDLADTKNNHPACDCVLVRAKIEVNPVTTALTITSNPPGTPDAIPTIIEGIPLDIQHVNITTTRSAFQFNPTNCDKMGIEATLHSVENATDLIKIPFQVTNCATLGFAPKLQVATSGKTSRASGESLSVKLTYPDAPFGSQANIARVKVELPKALPSRLTTLQKACSAAQFEANPAGCPPASIVGHAKAITPLIPVSLEGPAYFVSHGGEAFPSLIIVLQGYGVKVDLVGSTFINKAGITSSTFKTVPDQPVGSFELTLPQGPYSALAANGNLCKDKLAMPTEFVAQNGAEIHETTKITVTGCTKVVRHKRKKKKHHHRKT